MDAYELQDRKRRIEEAHAHAAAALDRIIQPGGPMAKILLAPVADRLSSTYLNAEDAAPMWDNLEEGLLIALACMGAGAWLCEKLRGVAKDFAVEFAEDVACAADKRGRD